MLCHSRVAVVALLGLLVGMSGCQPASDASSAGPVVSDTASSSPSLPDSVLTPPDSATAAQFASVMQYAMEHRTEASSVGGLMQMIGLQFKGRPYVAGTLDEPSTETLVVQLDGFDCVTFVETALAMARGAMTGDSTYAGFARRMAEQRYRDGRMQGYCSRLHYFTEWLADNEDRGIVERIDDDLGGRRMVDTLDFMSTHRSDYDKFATNDSLFACVQQMEQDLQMRQQERPVYFVSQDSIRAVYDQLQAGDIVALATSIDGLDVAYTGLVYAHDDGGRGLLHASLSDGVVVSPDLQRYVQKIDHQIGIVIARPKIGR